MTASLPRPVLLAIVGVVLFVGCSCFTPFAFVGGSDTASTRCRLPAQQTPASPAPASKPAPADQCTPRTADAKTSGEGLPVAVGRALDKKKVVVLLFWNRKAVDDRSVHSRSPGSRVTVARSPSSTTRVRNLSHYTRITGDRPGDADAVAGDRRPSRRCPR